MTQKDELSVGDVKYLRMNGLPMKGQSVIFCVYPRFRNISEAQEEDLTHKIPRPADGIAGMSRDMAPTNPDITGNFPC